MKSVIAKSLKSGSKTGSNSWTLRLFTLLIWLLASLCAAYWAFKFVTTKPVEATAALAAPTVVVDAKAVAKLLGATDNIAAKAVNTPASTKFVLFGLANSAGGQGVALIALDGKPAKPYRVGSMVADNLVLKSISKTGVMLASSLQAPDGVTLELPDRKPVTTVANFSNMGNSPGKIVDLQSVRTASPAPIQPPAAPAPTAVPVQIPQQAPNIGQASGLAAGAAAAVSRFAPQASSQAPDSLAAGRPPSQARGE